MARPAAPPNAQPSTSERPSSRQQVSIPVLVLRTAVVALVVGLVAGAAAVWILGRQVSSPTTTPAADPTISVGGTVTVTAPSGPPGEKFGTFPGPDNTGVPVGTVLRQQYGNLRISKPGTVIDRIDLAGCIVVAAADVTIKRSRIRGSCAEGTIGPAYQTTMSKVLIEDVEVDGLNQSTSYSLIAGESFTCRRCDLHGGGTGIRAGDDTVVEDSWLHGNHVGGDSHNTALSIHGGTNITIRHNLLQCDGGYNCSSALSLYPRDGRIDHVLVENNLFSGGGYCVYGGVYRDTDGSNLAATNVRFHNNGFLANQWPRCGDLGPVAAWEYPVEGNEWSGNYWYPNRDKVVTGN